MMKNEIVEYCSGIRRIFEEASTTWVARRVEIGSKVIDAVQVITSRSPICLVGDPGSGKTTILHMAAYSLCQADHSQQIIPFFVRAATNLNSKLSLPEWIASSLTVEKDLKFIAKTLSQGRALILVDGLDEIQHQHRESALSIITRWLIEYPTNQWVYSSRPIGLPVFPESVEIARLLDLSPVEISDVSHMLIRDEQQASSLANAISTQRDLAALASSPFLMSLIVRLFKYQHALPSAKADLYASWTDIALRQWDKSRGIGRRLEYLTLEQTRRSLEKLALRLSLDKKIGFDTSDWFSILREELGASDEVMKQGEITFYENILGSGLVRRISDTAYAFSHLTLQEYFSALALLRIETGEALLLLEQVPRETAVFFAENTKDPMRTARFFIKEERFDDVRRLVNAFPHLQLTEREEIVAMMAEYFGVSEITFRKYKIDDELSDIQGEKCELKILWYECHGELSAHEKGMKFEEFAKKLFGMVFEVVEVRRLTTFGEIDIICEVKANSFWIRWPGDCFVECKNYKDTVSVSIANEFIGKCSTARVRLAFLMTAGPLTKPSRERVARSWSQADIPDMAWIDGDDIQDWLENDIDAEQFLKNTVRRASYGTN